MTSKNDTTLRLSDVEEKDLEAISDVFFRGFHDRPYFRAMVADTPEARHALAAATKLILKDSYTRVLKVTDSQTGELISMGRWVLPRKDTDQDQPGTADDRWGSLPACCDGELAQGLFGSFARYRAEMMAMRKHYCEE